MIVNTKNRLSTSDPLAWPSAIGLLAQTSGMASGIILARSLTLEGRGEVAAILVLITIAGSIGDFGWPVVFPATLRQTDTHFTSSSLRFISLAHSLTYAALAGAAVIAFGDLDTTLAAIGVAYVGVDIASRQIVELGKVPTPSVSYFLARSSPTLCLPFAYVALVLSNNDAEPINFVMAYVSCSAVGLAASLLSARDRPLFSFPAVSKTDIEHLYKSGILSMVGNIRPVDTFRPEILFLAAASTSQAGGLAVAAAPAIALRGLGHSVLPTVWRGESRNSADLQKGSFLLHLGGSIAAPLALPFVFGAQFAEFRLESSLLVLASAASFAKAVVYESWKRDGFGPTASRFEVFLLLAWGLLLFALSLFKLSALTVSVGLLWLNFVAFIVVSNWVLEKQ